MGLSKITINKGKGGIGRAPISQDHISGLLFYNDTLPSGFSASARVKAVFSLEEAEDLGITLATHAVEHYHIDEFFKANPTGELWIGIYAVPVGSYDFAEITTMNQTVQGRMRQIGVFNANDEAFASAACTTLQAIVDALPGTARRMHVFYHADFNGIAHGSLTDLRTLACPDVSVVLGEDGGGTGSALRTSESHSISCLGALLGHVSRSPVNESPGYAAEHNFSDGVEFETASLATGTGDLVADLTEAALASVKDKGYQILRKYTPELAGTYSERVPTATPSTDDYAWQEVSRTMHKAIRQVTLAYLPDLNRPLTLNEDGTLTDEVVDYFTALGNTALNQMQVDGEISAFGIKIDPTQNVLSTSKLVLSIQIIPTGTAEVIEVNIGLATSIT